MTDTHQRGSFRAGQGQHIANHVIAVGEQQADVY
jgi:hypothetical protein